MLNAEHKQFSLDLHGQVLYQKQASNPLPGEPIARLRKGQNALAPEVDLLEHPAISSEDQKAAKDKILSWLADHIKEVLEPLVNMQDTESLPGPVKGICFQVHESMGITPREELEDLIKDLDTEMRQQLRDKKIRLGPILAFVPALNKPAAVKLRGLLWSLWNEKPLPIELPKEGIVSFQIDPKTIDRAFHQAIAYPVFGPRAIRIDMLDRVISAIYDSAEGGKFQAQHKMAEWLGSSIEDLYAILRAMGHVHIKPEEPETKEETQGEGAAEELKPEETKPEENKTEDNKGEVKPDLDWFYLKKGKAFEKRKPKKKDFKSQKQKPHKKGKKADKPKGPRVIQTGPEKKLEDSPFAILEQLRTNKN